MVTNLQQPPTIPLAASWFGDAASTIGSDVDKVFNIITLIAAAFFVLVVGLMIVFLVKYRARPGHTEQPSPSHNNALEIIWSVIPVLLVALIFFLGFTGFMDMRTPPDDAWEINVIAEKWNWTFRYPGGNTTTRLHVPEGRPIRLVQQSKDVLHSLYIPAFRTKMDCVPGRYTYQWFEANQVGTFDLFCAEYCGTQHSQMNTVVVVHGSQAECDEAIAAENKPDAYLPDWGEKLWSKRGCQQCHSVDGTQKAGGGPSWTETFKPGNQPLTFANAAPVEADENYILESIRKPQAKIRAGYQGVNMAAYPESLISQDEVDAIIAYMKVLGGVYDGPTREEAEAAAKAAEEAEAGEADTTPADGDEPADEESEENGSTAPEAGDLQS